MHARILALAISALFAFPAFGQTPAQPNVDRVFRFAHAQTPPHYQELRNAIRAVAIIQQAVVDNEARSLTLRGTAGQIALAEWLFTGLDKPAKRPPDSATHEYRIPDRSDDVARVFYLTHPDSPQAMQEIVNAIRSVSDLQRVAVCNAPKALAMRGTVSQMTLADWIVRELDKPAVGQTPPSPNPATYEYRDPVFPNNTVRIFYLAQVDTPERFQETVNMVRSIAKIQRVVAYFPLRAIVWRGTSDQSLQAERLLRERANPATQ